MNNFDLTKKGIFKYTLPILCSTILEELIILSDSVLLSFKEPVYLATVGVIDSIYLLFLAFGESLNDAFQNFYGSPVKPCVLKLTDKISLIQNYCLPLWLYTKESHL